MKKTILFGMMSASVVFTACGVDDTVAESNDAVLGGMTLTATVAENGGTRATIGDGENGNWKFAFTEGDAINVRNAVMESGKSYTFTKGGTAFTSSDAAPTGTAVDWYAYFPGTEVSLANQNFTDKASVAAKYALAGKTSESTDGKSGLSITLEPQVAVLVITTPAAQSINIYVKTDGKFVSGLKAKEGEAGFGVQTSGEKVSLLSSDNAGTYYVAVPAGIQIEILDGDVLVKKTKKAGLTAGRYYNIGINCKVCSDGKHPHAIDLGLPSGTKWACCNVGASAPERYGGYYAWGETEGKERYAEDNYAYYQNGSDVKIGDDNGIISGTDYDVAYKTSGGKWKMPTEAQYEELIANCTCEWTTLNGVSGILVTGKKNGAGIFFPAAGLWRSDGLKIVGSNGYYWSGVLYNNSWSYFFNFNSEYWNKSYNGARYQGRSVRAVCP